MNKLSITNLTKTIIKSLIITSMFLTTSIPTLATTTNHNAEIQSINHIDNSITVQTDNNNLYTFYIDSVESYYLSENIIVSIDNNNQILSCKIINKPIVYNTQIYSIQGNTATIIINNNKYTFEKEIGSEWQIGDKCKAVIQNDKLLEIKPIPLNES